MTRNVLGIEVPAGTDAFDPQNDMVELGASLEGRIIIPVANVAARTALATTLGPTPAEPLYVHRADAPAGLETEYSTNGTTWRSVSVAMRTGVASGTTSAGGDLLVTFSTPFPTQCDMVTVIDMTTGAGIGMIAWKLMARAAATATLRAFPGTGTSPITNTPVSVGYIAVGS